ncbi:hypothetical protein [Novosphingobium sp.]|uniref:hypothetical protein n=1 Tax=Novosphingobium sp. TaxID=1874826 RepID=UPI0025F6897C|nr:hypothetical protein [Novosphingobium sp.]MCC6926616.1 hypothetical protein [Novosphingobium sp.]
MARSSTLNRDERLALALAVLGHGALLAVLVWQRPPAPLPPPERMMVTISDEVGLTSAAPEPMAQPAPDTGPVVGKEPPPPAPEPVPVAKPVPAPPRPAPAPVAKAPAKPAPPVKPVSTPKAAPAPPKTPPKTVTRPGSSAFDDAFNKGIPGAKSPGKAQTPPAQITGAVRSSLASEVARQLKRKWQGPNGLDVEKLATTVEWSLNPDGTLAGQPRVVSQTGITDDNRPQVKRHQEQAVKAVRLAAPFTTLPPQYYSAWKTLRFTFDWKINQ